jgi:hypothetical protein
MHPSDTRRGPAPTPGNGPLGRPPGGPPYVHRGPGTGPYSNSDLARGPAFEDVPQAPQHPPSQKQQAAQALAAALACGDLADLLAEFADVLCACVSKSLHNTQTGVRLSGHLAPPPGAFGLFGIAGIDDAAPIPLPGLGTDFVTVLELAAATEAHVGAIKSVGVAVEDPFFWVGVEWQIVRDGQVIYGPWVGQIGTIEAPTAVGPFNLTRGGNFQVQARNPFVNPVNAAAVLHGWQFSTPPSGEKPYMQYWRDQG